MKTNGSVGFRLAHELEGILTGVRADGLIDEREVGRIRRWLAENEAHSSLPPFAEISTHLRRALGDGVLTVDECDDLLFMIGKSTTVNPYFDALRAGTQVLMGLLAGISADGTLTDGEVTTLKQWIASWEHLQGIWPFDECCTIVTCMVARGRVAEQREYLFDLAAQFPVAGYLDEQTGELPPLLVKGICATNPTIQFLGSRFVFTGESTKADRRELEALVVELGGYPWPSVTAETSFLVVCDNGNPFWAFSCYGRKVEHAYNLRKKGHQVCIVHELDFWDAVADTRAGV